MLGGFGDSGQLQSQQYAWQPCVICRAPIRVSWFLLLFIAYRLVTSLQNGFHLSVLLLISGQQGILILTVLCHEFGHGTMARWIGGEIDHILLWPFGGICFSSRPSGITDPRKLLQNELKVVAAGPSTHFFMTPIWALLLCGFGELVSRFGCPIESCTTCSGFGCALAWLNPLGTSATYYVDAQQVPLMGKWNALLWELLGLGVQMNVALFLFNVLFPMYPADGAKLLTTGLMYCCGVSARLAALVLICCSFVCASAMIGYSLWSVMVGINAGAGSNALMSGLMGLMGVMSLVEAYKLHQMREQRQLHKHPLFQTARSQIVTQHDGSGMVTTFNQQGLDDPAEFDVPRVASWQCFCCPFGQNSAAAFDEDDSAHELAMLNTLSPEERATRRAERDQFLRGVEARR